MAKKYNGDLSIFIDDKQNVIRHPLLLSLPDEVAEWAGQNREMILKIQEALNRTHETLTADKIWEAIASSSEEWQSAKQNLDAAEIQWNDLHRPENKPLGAIGKALESEKIKSTAEQHTVSLAEFTFVDEGLRQRPDLSALFNVLVVQKRILDSSAQMTMDLQSTTADLMMLPLGDVEEKAAKEKHKEKRTTGINKAFGMYARKFLRKQDDNEITPAPALSSPKSS